MPATAGRSLSLAHFFRTSLRVLFDFARLAVLATRSRGALAAEDLSVDRTASGKLMSPRVLMVSAPARVEL